MVHKAEVWQVSTATVTRAEAAALAESGRDADGAGRGRGVPVLAPSGGCQLSSEVITCLMRV